MSKPECPKARDGHHRPITVGKYVKCRICGQRIRRLP